MFVTGGTRVFGKPVKLGVSPYLDQACGLSDVWAFHVANCSWTLLSPHSGFCENVASNSVVFPNVAFLTVVLASLFLFQ